MLQTVPDNHAYAIQFRDAAGGDLRIASGDQNSCPWISPVRPADELTGLKIGKCGNRAGIDDVNIGDGIERNN